MNAVEIVFAVIEEVEDHYKSSARDKDEELIDYLYELFEIEKRAKEKKKAQDIADRFNKEGSW